MPPWISGVLPSRPRTKLDRAQPDRAIAGRESNVPRFGDAPLQPPAVVLEQEKEVRVVPVVQLAAGGQCLRYQERMAVNRLSYSKCQSEGLETVTTVYSRLRPIPHAPQEGAQLVAQRLAVVRQERPDPRAVRVIEPDAHAPAADIVHRHVCARLEKSELADLFG